MKKLVLLGINSPLADMPVEIRKLYDPTPSVILEAFKDFAQKGTRTVVVLHPYPLAGEVELRMWRAFLQATGTEKRLILWAMEVCKIAEGLEELDPSQEVSNPKSEESFKKNQISSEEEDTGNEPEVGISQKVKKLAKRTVELLLEDSDEENS